MSHTGRDDSQLSGQIAIASDNSSHKSTDAVTKSKNVWLLTFKS